MNAGDRFEVVMDYRGGGLLGRRGWIVERVGTSIPSDYSLVRTRLDGDFETTVFYVQELRALDPVMLLAELAP